MSKLHQLVGQNLRRIRERRGYSQEKLAARAELSSSYVSRVELGKENISVRSIERICVVLDISPADLFRGSGRSRKPRE
jgi:transcriptional regulator with XRE-family HTH domain